MEYVESIEWEYVWSVETMWSQEIKIGRKAEFVQDGKFGKWLSKICGVHKNP